MAHGLEKKTSPRDLGQTNVEKDLGNLSKKVVDVSSQVQDIGKWTDRQLEAKVLRTKLSGLLSQSNIQHSNLNLFEIEREKHGRVGVPIRLHDAIEDTKKVISETESQITQVKKQLASLH